MNTNVTDYANAIIAEVDTSSEYINPETGNTETATIDPEMLRPTIELTARISAQHTPLPFDTVSADAVIESPVNQVVLVDTSTGPVTITLPDPALCVGKTITLKKITGDSNLVTVDGNIDAGLTASFSLAYDYVSLFSDGTQFWMI